MVRTWSPLVGIEGRVRVFAIIPGSFPVILAEQQLDEAVNISSVTMTGGDCI